MAPHNSTVLPSIFENVAHVSFSWYDYTLFSVMLGLSALIGIYFGCFGSKQSSTDEYLMGDRKMKIFPISVSLVASHISGITLLAIPADIYRYGITWWLYVPALIPVTLGTNYIFLPVFYNLKITSTYEYLERRFDVKNRTLASFLFALGVLLYLPIVIYIPALAFSAATGINIHFITPVVCGVCIFYTTIGGLKAVVWTDTLQFTITTGAVFAVVVIGIKAAGGFGAIFATALEGDRLNILDFDPDPTKRDSFWIVFFGLAFSWLSTCGIHQSCVQKYLSVPTLKDAKLCVIYFSIGVAIVGSFSAMTGLIMYARYANCDPFTTGAVEKNDQLLPYYIMDVASHIPGLSGLFIAGIFCAALSTLSASLNCLAGTIFEDFIVKVTGPFENEKTAAFILKILVIVAGVICTALVFVIEKLGGILPLALSLGGVTAGPLMGMFSLGVLCPRASSRGTFYGAITGLIFTSWVIAMAQYYKSQGVIVYMPKPISVEGCPVSLNTTTGSFPIDSNASWLTTEKLESEASSTARMFLNLNQTTSDYPKLPQQEKYHPFFLFRISFYYYTLMGTLATMLCGYVLSLLLTNDDPPVHKDLLSPVILFLVTDKSDKMKDYYRIERAIHLVSANSEKDDEQIKI